VLTRTLNAIVDLAAFIASANGVVANDRAIYMPLKVASLRPLNRKAKGGFRRNCMR
jgi:hypothetical protein